MESVEVKTTLVEKVSTPIAQQLCEDFGEWLDTQGLMVVINPARAGKREDERGYAELAADFIEEYA
jgi:hypothetical protein